MRDSASVPDPVAGVFVDEVAGQGPGGQALLPRWGKRWPSDDRAPPPQASARGSQWWRLTRAALASLRVSSRRYHSVVQARASSLMPVASDISASDWLVAWARMAA